MLSIASHLTLCRITKQRMRRLAVQIPVLVLDAARGSPAAQEGRVDPSGEAALEPKGRCATQHQKTQACAKRLTDPCYPQRYAD
jgi:hypothetical protein